MSIIELYVNCLCSDILFFFPRHQFRVKQDFQFVISSSDSLFPRQVQMAKVATHLAVKSLL